MLRQSHLRQFAPPLMLEQPVVRRRVGSSNTGSTTTSSPSTSRSREPRNSSSSAPAASASSSRSRGASDRDKDKGNEKDSCSSRVRERLTKDDKSQQLQVATAATGAVVAGGGNLAASKPKTIRKRRKPTAVRLAHIFGNISCTTTLCGQNRIEIGSCVRIGARYYAVVRELIHTSNRVHACNIDWLLPKTPLTDGAAVRPSDFLLGPRHAAEVPIESICAVVGLCPPNL